LIKKRLSAFVTDMILTALLCAGLAFLSLFVMGVSALLFLPWVITYADTANAILFMLADMILLAGAIIYLFIISKTSRQTRGYKAYQLKVAETNKMRLFARWFIRTGIFGIMIFLFVYFWSHNIEFTYLLVVLFLYLAYLMVNAIVLVYTKGKKSFIDMWIGSEVKETDEKPELVRLINKGENQ